MILRERRGNAKSWCWLAKDENRLGLDALDGAGVGDLGKSDMISFVKQGERREETTYTGKRVLLGESVDIGSELSKSLARFSLTLSNNLDKVDKLLGSSLSLSLELFKRPKPCQFTADEKQGEGEEKRANAQQSERHGARNRPPSPSQVPSYYDS